MKLDYRYEFHRQIELFFYSKYIVMYIILTLDLLTVDIVKYDEIFKDENFKGEMLYLFFLH